MNLIVKIKNSIKSLDTTKKSGIINMVIKPIGLIIAFFSTPLLLKYFDEAKYGLWATLLSIMTWINYFDVGLGNGLRNILAKEIALDDKKAANKSVSTAYIVLSIIAFLLYAILLVSAFAINWNFLLNTNITIKPTLIIFFTFMCLNFVLSLSNILLYALQKSVLVAIRNYINQTINIIGLIILNNLCPNNLEALAVLFGSSTMITYIVTFVTITKKYKFLKFSINSFEYNKIKEISSVGARFFIIQICCLILFTTDNLLISHFFGTKDVTPFSITDKLFTTAYSFFAAFLIPYWSKTTVAFAKKDINWIKKSVKFSFKIDFLFTIGYFILLLLFKQIINIWIGNKVVFPNELPLIMCLYYSVYSILTVQCQFINGSGKILTQMIMYIIVAILNIPLSIFLGVTFNMGMSGIRLATLILLCFGVIVLGIDLNNIIKKAEINKENIIRE